MATKETLVDVIVARGVLVLDSSRHAVGDAVKLTKAEAQRLLDIGVVRKPGSDATAASNTVAES